MMLTRLLIAGRAVGNSTRILTRLDPGDVRCVLTSEVTRLGDVLTTIPALRHLRSILPHARIVSIVDQRFASLLRACDVKVEPVGVAGSDTLSGLFTAIRTARQYAPDLALSLSPSKRNAAIVLGSGAPRVAGYFKPLSHPAQHLCRSEVEAHGFALAHSAAYDHEHLERRAMHVVGAICGYPTEINRMITLRGEMRQIAIDGLRGRIPDLTLPFIVIHPFAGWRHRQWSTEKFVGLGNLLQDVYPFQQIYLCAREEAPALQAITSRMQVDKRVLVLSSDDLLQTATLLERAALFIGSDSGPLHLAALLGTPVVGLFGPSTPELTAPLVPHGEFLYEKVVCSPCIQTICLRPEDHCMQRLTPTGVLAAVDRLLHRSQVHQMAAYGE